MEKTEHTHWSIEAPRELFNDIWRELSVADKFLGQHISDRGMFPPDAHLAVEVRLDTLYITLKGNEVILLAAASPLDRAGEHIDVCRRFMAHLIGRAFRP